MYVGLLMRYFCSICPEIGTYRHILVRVPNIYFHENLSGRGRRGPFAASASSRYYLCECVQN